jgi:hypothetical protein
MIDLWLALRFKDCYAADDRSDSIIVGATFSKGYGASARH